MVCIPEEVMKVMGEPTTVKALVTSDAAGQPHAIVCGSIVAPAPDKVIVGEVLMKKSSKNLEATKKAAILVSAGMAAYEIVLANPVRITEGPGLDQMNEKLAAIHLKAGALWMFDVAEVYDQEPAPRPAPSSLETLLTCAAP